MGEEVDSNLELQEKIVTTLVNISYDEENRTVMAQKLTLGSLSLVDSNNIIIENSSETLKVLIDVSKR